MGGPVIRMVGRVDPPHRWHRLAFLVGVGEDAGEAGGDEEGVTEVTGKPDLVEDGCHHAVDVDRHGPAESTSQRSFECDRCGQVVARNLGLTGNRHESVESGVAALVLTVPESRYSPVLGSPVSHEFIGEVGE